jgi:hypothetical protein
MESVVNETPATTEEMPVVVTQDTNVTEQNQSEKQIRQQNFVVNTQETHKQKHNISSTVKLNTTSSQKNSLHTDDDTVEEIESGQLQNISILVNSDQKIHTKSYDDLDKVDNVPKTSYLSDALSPLTEKKDGTVPIRVILHYPHEHHHENGTVSEHEYIVLETGNPAYHGHLEKTAIPEKEIPDKNKNGLDTAEADKHQTPTWKHKGKKNRGKVKASTSGELRDTTESPEKTYQQHHNEWKKHKGEVGEDFHETEISKEISQDIRKHGNHQNNTEPSDNNTVQFHRGKGRHFHKTGHHKKHKFIQIVADENTNGTGSKGTMKAKGHKLPHVSTIEGRNETSKEVIIKSNNHENSSVEIIKKVEVHKKRPSGKKIKQEHHRTLVIEKLNAHPYPNTNTQNISLAQHSLIIPLSIAWHNAHRPIGAQNVDDELNETDDLNEDQPITFGLKQANMYKVEDLQKSFISTNDSTETSVDEMNENEHEVQGPGVHDEEYVTVTDLRKSNVGNTMDEPTSSSSQDSSDSEIYDDIIKHYSKLLKWIDYPL